MGKKRKPACNTFSRCDFSPMARYRYFTPALFTDADATIEDKISQLIKPCRLAVATEASSVARSLKLRHVELG